MIAFDEIPTVHLGVLLHDGRDDRLHDMGSTVKGDDYLDDPLFHLPVASFLPMECGGTFRCPHGLAAVYRTPSIIRRSQPISLNMRKTPVCNFIKAFPMNIY
jgi:hypothetical protein